MTKKVIARHTFFSPATFGVFRNNITTHSIESKKNRKVALPLKLACVGLLEIGKNQRFLLEIMKELKAENAQLVLYGIGQDELSLKEIVVNENLLDRVHFRGWVTSEQIWPEVDLLLMPSLHEGAPNAVLEAIGCGVPVLASDIPEHAEILIPESLFSIFSVEEWINFIDQDKQLLVKEIDKIAKKQSAFCTIHRFDWERQCVENIIKI